MSSTLPTAATAATGEVATLPRPRAMRLHSMLDVSRRPPNEGDVLTWNGTDGVWEPRPVPTPPVAVSDYSQEPLPLYE